jgi:hypothetical protein
VQRTALERADVRALCDQSYDLVRPDRFRHERHDDLILCAGVQPMPLTLMVPLTQRTTNATGDVPDRLTHAYP